MSTVTAKPFYDPEHPAAQSLRKLSKSTLLLNWSYSGSRNKELASRVAQLEEDISRATTRVGANKDELVEDHCTVALQELLIRDLMGY